MEILQPSWRGRNISTRKDSDGKYTAMVGNDSMLYVPATVSQNAVYKITLEMAKKSGNGLVYCNVYGNRNYDFPHVKFICDSRIWASYTFELRTGAFPKTVPMIFRIWREPGGTGSLLIRRVHVELTEPRENDETAPEQPDIAKGLTPVIKKKIGPVEPPQAIAVPKKNVTDRLKSEREARREGRRKARLEKEKNRKAKKNPNPGPGSNIPVKVTRAPPKVEELAPGGDGIKNSVIISIQNRRDFLDRTLRTYARQTMPKSEFEIVIVDDNSQEDILGLCKMHAKESGLQFQYIKMDTNKGAVPQKGFTPALSNNIGFKQARGSVLIITGPETLQSERNLEYTWETCKNPVCLYGVVHRSSAEFVKRIRDPEFWKSYQSFDSFFNIPGALSVRADTTGFWWYYAAAKKEYIMAMNGVDEKFMGGICGEDDDFANRMNFLGVKLEYNRKVLGIHQDHSNEDRVDPVHDIRFNKKKWKKLRAHNLALLSQCISNRDPVANKGIDWGTEKAIITKEIF